MGNIFGSELIGWVWAPLAVGVTLWAVAEVVRTLVQSVSNRRRRRMRIVSLVGQAESLVIRAVRDGLFDEAFISRSSEPLASLRSLYDDLTLETLSLFEKREGAVAFWTAVELYAGFDDPLRYLRLAGVRRKRASDGVPILYPTQARNLWYPPRPEMLSKWADRRALWVRGNTKGPWYGGTISTGGDKSRHDAVTPNACMPGDIILPPSWYELEGSLESHYVPFVRESGGL